MLRYFVEVHAPRATPERHELEAGSYRLGTGGEDAVRLPLGTGYGASVLAITLSPEYADVTATDQLPQGIAFNGVPVRQARVPWGEEIYLGAIRVTFSKEAKAKRGPSPVLLVAAVVALGALALSFLPDLEPSLGSGAEVEAPPLVSAAAPCRERDPAAAAHLAQDAESAARAKQERYPFARHDGVEALRLYSEASACFENAGRVPDAARAKDELKRWSSYMDEEYAGLKLRLRVALEHEHYDEALSATRGIEALVGSSSAAPAGKYGEWLSSLRRELESKVQP